MEARKKARKVGKSSKRSSGSCDSLNPVFTQSGPLSDSHGGWSGISDFEKPGLAGGDMVGGMFNAERQGPRCSQGWRPDGRVAVPTELEEAIPKQETKDKPSQAARKMVMIDRFEPHHWPALLGFALPPEAQATHGGRSKLSPTKGNGIRTQACVDVERRGHGCMGFAVREL
ncbi:hypothetical protein FZEAL_4203 [Fusarium zealandicum]|uniref:Uncharacterized protein n=1 Tax=Fusarium zealandicum TaxID=1053134 RepID=A0A8H4UN10_9HYPO|nr:hypothetical protein FZEAL_4203 [Fusarium zealandicum]